MILETEGYISNYFYSPHKTLEHSVIITLYESCINYFEHKKQAQKHNRKELIKEFRAWITLIIAIAGFVLSVISLYLDMLPTE